MYRQYEDPEMLEGMIERLEIAMSEAITAEDEDMQIRIGEELAELNDRLRFAYADEYEEE